VKLRLRVSGRTGRDLEEQYLWYEFQRHRLGDEFFASATAVFRATQNNPFIYPVVRRRVRREPMQRFPYGVFFSVSDEEAAVLAVVHDRKHSRLWLRRLGRHFT
jgi:toxin ParE1/3/4